MTKYWCGVVSKEHIMRGVAGGFCQVCHGKRAPLARMSVGDGIVFTCGRTNWGFQFRRGHFEITGADYQLIAQSMLPVS